jgi:hypothetical protein
MTDTKGESIYHTLEEFFKEKKFLCVIYYQLRPMVLQQW